MLYEEGTFRLKTAPIGGVAFIALLIFFLSPKAAFSADFLSNETSLIELSTNAQGSIRQAYPKYLKDFRQREKARKEKWGKGIEQAQPVSSAPAEYTWVSKPTKPYVGNQPQTYQEFFDTRSFLFRLSLAMRNTMLEETLLEREREVVWSEFVKEKPLLSDQVLSPQLRTLFQHTFEQNRFEDFYRRSVKPLLAHQQWPEPYSGYTHAKIRQWVQTSLTGWAIDREIYRENVLRRRELIGKKCKIDYRIDTFAGNWFCPDSAAKALSDPTYILGKDQLEKRIAVWRFAKAKHWSENKFLTTPMFSRSTLEPGWDMDEINWDSVSLTRFEVDHYDGLYLERDNSKFTGIQAYQLIANIALEDMYGKWRLPKKVLDSFPNYQAWVTENLTSKDTENINLDLLSNSAYQKIEKVIARTLEVSLDRNERTLRYLMELDDPWFIERGMRSVQNIFTGDETRHFSHEPKDINKTILKFADLLPYYLNSPGLRLLLQKVYHFPDIGSPEIARELLKVVAERQEQIQARTNLNNTIIWSSIGVATIITWASAGSTLAMISGLLQTALSWGIIWDGYAQSINQTSIVESLYYQLTKNAYGITEAEMTRAQVIQESELKNVFTFAMMTGVEVVGFAFFRSMTHVGKLKRSNLFELKDAVLADAKIRIRMIQSVVKTHKLDDFSVLEFMFDRPRIKATRLADVLTDTISELKLQGKDTSSVEAFLGKYHSEFEKRLARLKESLMDTQNPVHIDSEQIQFEIKFTPEVAKLHAASSSKAIFANEYKSFTDWLSSIAPEIEETSTHAFESAGINGRRVIEISKRANASGVIEHMDASNELLHKILNHRIDEEGLLVLLGEADSIIKILGRNKNILARDWTDIREIQKSMQELRFDHLTSPQVGKYAQWLDDHVPALAKTLRNDKLPQVPDEELSHSARIQRQLAKGLGRFIGADYDWVNKLDDELYFNRTMAGKWYPKHVARNIVQGLSVNVFTMLIGDRGPRTIHSLMDGDSFQTALTKDLDRTAINFTASFVQAFTSTHIPLSNLTFFPRALATVQAAHPAVMLSVTLNGLASGGIFDDECLAAALRRVYVDTGYTFIVSASRRKEVMNLMGAFKQLGDETKWKTGLAVSSARAVDMMVVGRGLWLAIGEGIFQASGACDHKSEEFLNDVKIFIPENRKAAIGNNIAHAFGTDRIIQEGMVQSVRDISPANDDFSLPAD